MAEIGEVQPEGPIRQEAHKLAHGVEVGRLAVRSEPHHLVLVAIVRKAEILRERLVEDAERMRKIYPPCDRKIGPVPRPQAALEKSPKPSTETVTASSNGET